VWIAGSLPVSLQRAGEHFDGWLPNAGDALQWGQRSAQIRAVAREAGRNPDRLEGAM
jgi:alkanesulfonate monooxygenase SsuD/methylene tetrahydromethanopterin reductase-like flavin-dependent oxidoreductase (luciferase family)